MADKQHHIDQVSQARHRFFQHQAFSHGIIPTVIEQSWQRCLESGISHQSNLSEACLSNAELVDLKRENASLLKFAKPQLESLYGQIRQSQCAVLLADASGNILHGVGDTDFVPKARQVELMPGGVWNEAVRGTNAIGTAAHNGQEVVVHAQQHYLEQNGFLTCAAVPIFDPRGRVLGVLDVSSDAAHPQQHTLALVKLAASLIENRLLEEEFEHHDVLFLHPDQNLLSGLDEGMLAYEADGTVVGINRWARQHLSLPNGVLTHLTLEDLFEKSPTLIGQGRLSTAQGQTLHVRVKERSARLPSKREQPVQDLHESALEGLHFGDDYVAKNLERARRVLGRDVPILLQGETGVGKEVWANALHQASPKREGPLVVVNCAAIPESLIESELFGYRSGAFTGAAKDGASGLVIEANGGTLFLDEIGDMPLPLQTRLLRVLQERKVVPVGGGTPVSVDFDVISATNVDLMKMVDQGQFRRDLYYRLNGLVLSLPPLRERQDLAALIESIIHDEGGGKLNSRVWKLFTQYQWPGNLRQLRSVIRTVLALTDPGEPVSIDLVPEEITAQATEHGNVQGSLATQEKQTIVNTLEKHKGNMSATARELGIDRSTLYRKLDQFGLR